MRREPMVLLGYPLERHAIERPVTFAGVCGALFIVGCCVAEAILSGANL